MKDYLSAKPWLLADHPKPSRRDWLAPIDYLAEPHDCETRDVVRVADTDIAVMRFSEAGDGPVLEGRMVPYGEWTEVRSRTEGHFLERFAAGSLIGNTIREQASRIRVLFEHGMDSVFGRQPIASVEEMRDEPDGAYYRARLLDGVPPLLVAGLRRGLYGSSVRFEPIEQDRVRHPTRSSHNPQGIPEHTVKRAKIREFSVVTFPQYAGATAMVRVEREEAR
jgi:HK97 family phage prohead protease